MLPRFLFFFFFSFQCFLNWSEVQTSETVRHSNQKHHTWNELTSSLIRKGDKISKNRNAHKSPLAKWRQYAWKPNKRLQTSNPFPWKSKIPKLPFSMVYAEILVPQPASVGLAISNNRETGRAGDDEPKFYKFIISKIGNNMMNGVHLYCIILFQGHMAMHAMPVQNYLCMAFWWLSLTKLIISF